MFKALRRALLISLIFAACAAYPRSAEAAAALIDFVQGALNPVAGIALIGVTGTSVGITNAVNAGIASWQVDLVYVPTGSGLSVSTIASNNSSTTPAAAFTPDVAGCFRVREQVWTVMNRTGTPADTDIRNFCVPELGTAMIVPPYQGVPARVLTKPDELNFGSQMFGYAGTGLSSDGLEAYQMKQLARISGGAAGTISGGITGASLAAAIAFANATSCACTIQLGPYTYVLPAQQVINVSGLSIRGLGVGSTFIDDAGLSGADAFVINSVLYFGMYDLTITASTQRTAGAALLVKGANTIIATPAQHTHQYTIERVNMEQQFIGMEMIDTPGSPPQGAWGGFIHDGEWINFAAGGVAIWINSPGGGQHYIRDMKIYGGGNPDVLDANRPLAAVRYSGGSDVEMVNVNEVFMRHGLIVDPPSGVTAAVTFATACLWDNNTQQSIWFENSGGTILGAQITAGWAYTSTFGFPCVEIDNGTNITIEGGTYWKEWQAFKIIGTAPKNISIDHTDCNGSIAGLYVTGGATDWSYTNNRVTSGFTVTPTVGAQIDAGSDNYIVTGNSFYQATTPLINTPGTSSSRIVMGNL